MLKKTKSDKKVEKLTLKKESLRRLTLTDDQLKAVAGGALMGSAPTEPGC